MDPVTQGLLGAGLAQSFVKKTNVKLAALCGALGGMTPDLDTLIRSSDDPLMHIEYHRHFTHSLAFIPIGGFLVAAAIWLILLRRKTTFSTIYIFTTFGFATHALLDACTSYGTRLLWPFDSTRIAWNVISVIDPIYTFTLIFFVILSLKKKSAKIMQIGIIITSLYLVLGYYQKHRVEQHVLELAEARGHKVERILLNPTIGNNILWRSVYEADSRYYIDAVRAPWFSDISFKEGANIIAIRKEEFFPSIPTGSLQRNDIDRFSYFSQDYIYTPPSNPNIIADLRYGTLPYDTNSMWGIEVDSNDSNKHVKWKNLRNINERKLDEFWDMLVNGF